MLSGGGGVIKTVNDVHSFVGKPSEDPAAQMVYCVDTEGVVIVKLGLEI